MKYLTSMWANRVLRDGPEDPGLPLGGTRASAATPASRWLDAPDGDGLWWYSAPGKGGWHQPVLTAVAGDQAVVLFGPQIKTFGGTVAIKRGLFRWYKQPLPPAPTGAV